MRLGFIALAALSILTLSTVLEGRVDGSKYAGTYLSEPFEAGVPETGAPDIRSELLVLHADGTAARYISTSIGSFATDQNVGGIALTPSFGTWEVVSDCERNVARAVFFDYFNLSKAGCEADECDALQQLWTEYDRITYTLRFEDVVNGKYQTVFSNSLLLGILANSCQDPANPADLLCNPTLGTYTDAFECTNALRTAGRIDPVADLVARSAVFHRVNNNDCYIYPSTP